MDPLRIQHDIDIAAFRAVIKPRAKQAHPRTRAGKLEYRLSNKRNLVVGQAHGSVRSLMAPDVIELLPDQLQMLTQSEIPFSFSDAPSH